MQALTNRQQEVLNLIKLFAEETGFAPTLSELEEALGITKRAVVKHLDALQKKRLIFRTSETRGIKLLENAQSQLFLDISILGYANAGSPMVEANEENIGFLRVRKNLMQIDRNTFALIIKGDSMNRKLINGSVLENGNYALISKSNQIKNGDAVLAIIDNCATIKSFKQEKNLIILYPESSNQNHQPFYLDANQEDAALIYGKVVGVLDNPMK